MEPLVGRCGEFFEHVTKVREGLDAVKLAGFDDAVEGRRPFPTGIIPNK